MVRNFSSLICPDVSAPAALASLLFDPPEPLKIGKHSVSRLSYLFAHLHLVFTPKLRYKYIPMGIGVRL